MAKNSQSFGLRMDGLPKKVSEVGSFNIEKQLSKLTSFVRQVTLDGYKVLGIM